jgi:alanine racemase
MKRRDFLDFLGVGSLAPWFDSKEVSQAISEKTNSKGFMDPWIEINLDNISWNLKKIRELVKVPIMAVIKANAYGHGLFEIARFLEKEGVEGLMVGKIEEAVKLRRGGIRCPILNFGPFSKEDCEIILSENFSQSVFTEDVFHLNEMALKLKKIGKIHIHIDTGLGRTGISYRQALSFIERVSKLSNLKIEGISTDLSEDREFDLEQLKRFQEICYSAKNKGISIGMRHAGSSDGIINLKESHLDMVRPGITIYGYYPSPQTQKEDKLSLKPALSLKAKVIYLKELLPGDSLSYHRTFVAQKKELVATVGAGYSDGYPPQLSGRTHVLIQNKRFPVIATVTANHIMVNLENDRGIKIGDEVILINNKKGELGADELSDLCGLSVYKILIGLNSLLPRKYISKSD